MYKYVQNRVLTYLKFFIAGADFFCLNLIFYFTVWFSQHSNLLDVSHLSETNFRTLWITFILVVTTASFATRIYSDQKIEFLERVFRSTIQTGLITLSVFAAVIVVSYSWPSSIYFLTYLTFFLIIYGIVSRFVLAYIYIILPKRMGWAKEVVLIGHSEYLSAAVSCFPSNHPFYNIHTIPYYDDLDTGSKESRIVKFKRYFEEVSAQGIHEVFLVNSPDVLVYTDEIINAANSKCVQLNFLQAISANIHYHNNGRDMLSLDLPVLRSHSNSLSEMNNRIKKRLLDLLISSAVIVFILSWLVPIIGILIKIQSPGPIFFKQDRSGRNNKSFKCLKFRSMVVNRDSNKVQATKDDRRITAIGKFLRKSNLDEFPQFINVFLGQMSIVGPRPHMLAHTEHYSHLIQHYMVRHFVKPGITGWAQVNGYRGETNTPELMAKRVEYDLEYINNWSLMLDLKIVVMTAWNMIKGEKNAY